MIEILKQEIFYKKCGTAKYKVQWRGYYKDEQELINAVDGSSSNYGGYVRFLKKENGVSFGIVHVYYD